ncbi:ABC transporter ATP-binding protein [Frankia sp. AgB1.9]|nr:MULTISPECIES: ABC transporter ATP-binding protein [unclassified Frankia]MBL7494616.1 ABC transporter ATP-binding protein [Frankia sp. AgW1.1]MBL7552979.1 ABC transporter ATP-binding protein [Frankia sp. AgB1.9]MBL7625180.1 ABC transporter ATP-binding protein [Frankia sp. AgB1.8]
MYKLTGVSKTYSNGKKRVDALQEVDLTIDDGQLVAIQGPTGGGKSTLLQMLGALDRPTAGSVLLGDQDLARASAARLTKLRASEVGIVFQGFNLIPTLTAQENVEAALVPLGIRKAQRRERAAAALASVGLADRAAHRPAELSGGQQQRVAIARALVKSPKVLLADEPTGNLDEETRDEIVALLEGLWRDQGLTLVIVTHDSQVASRAQRRLQLTRGKLREAGPGKNAATRPAPAADEATTWSRPAERTAVEPAAVEPAAVEPATVEAVIAEAAPVEPAAAEADGVALSEPVAAEPAAVEAGQETSDND